MTTNLSLEAMENALETLLMDAGHVKAIADKVVLVDGSLWELTDLQGAPKERALALKNRANKHGALPMLIKFSEEYDLGPMPGGCAQG